MRHLKSFKLFEELDTDSATDNKMRTNSKNLVDAAKKYEQLLAKEGIKLISKNVSSSDEARKLRSEAINKIKSGDKNAYGLMQWSGDICQDFQIITPEKGIEVVGAPKYGNNVDIKYTQYDNWASLEYYNSPNEVKSLYMMADGDVLFQWDSYEKKSKGSLAGKAQQII